MRHVVYVLECGDGSFYTGYTTDLPRRVREHRRGDGARYTRGRTPLEVVHVERFDSRSAALSREHEIKQLTRAAKEQLTRAGGERPTRADEEGPPRADEEQPTRADEEQLRDGDGE